MTIIPLTNNC